ncbi:MAG TPA: ABC transporter substrate-binding protein [Symbiobacteriaceae bacterium]|jgi:ABC-type nitrate/sulfonate/bicarbonate transport system substrate-binding protein
MNFMKRRLAVLLVLVFSLALIAGCGGKAAAPAPAEAPKTAEPQKAAPPAPATVKVGNVSSLLFAPFYVAMEKGYFQEQNITVQLENLQAGQDAMVFLANGQLDFVLAGYSAALFNAVSRGMDLKVIAPMGIQPKQGDPSPLVVRTDLVQSGAVTSAKDLKGKKIAAAGGAGATGSFLIALRLQKYGLALSDVELVNLGLPDQQAGLANKAVDAALMSEPYSTKAIADGTGSAVDKGVLAGVNASGLLTSGAMLKDKADVVNRFTTALLKAARDIQGDKFKSDENIGFFAKYTKLAPDVLKNVTPYDFDTNFALTSPNRDLGALQEIMAKAGILKLQSPVDVAKVVDGGPAAAAVAKLGK